MLLVNRSGATPHISPHGNSGYNLRVARLVNFQAERLGDVLELSHQRSQSPTSAFGPRALLNDNGKLDNRNNVWLWQP